MQDNNDEMLFFSSPNPGVRRFIRRMAKPPRRGRILPPPEAEKGRSRPSEPQSIERDSALCDDGELRRWDECAEKNVARGFSRGHPLIPIRSSGMYGARTKSRQRFLPCTFAARECRRHDRQRCWGVCVGGSKDPHAVTVQSMTEQLPDLSKMRLCFHADLHTIDITTERSTSP